jgi:hypothetical protein
VATLGFTQSCRGRRARGHGAGAIVQRTLGSRAYVVDGPLNALVRERHRYAPSGTM